MSFTVRLKLPPEVEQRIRQEKSDIAEDVKEEYAVELLRRGKLSHYELSSVLALSQLETDACQKRHKVFEVSLTHEDVEEDYQTLRQLHMKKP